MASTTSSSGPEHQLLSAARDVRRALVACAVLGWLGLLMHLLLQWLASRPCT